ncbi:MAG: TRAP transporter fused permease subunit [Firmicutes bacterium]|nr:TRAP transporter fused permease subunit [Bacillota bacterium]
MEKEKIETSEIKVTEKTGERNRSFQGWLAKLVIGIAVAMSCYQIAISLGIIYLNPYAHRAIHLSFALVLAFFLYPVRKNKSDNNKLPLLDMLFILGVICFCGYIFYQQQFNEEALAMRVGATTTYEIILGIVAVILLLEATRRLMGVVLPIIIMAFIAYPFVSVYLPGVLRTGGFSLERVTNLIYISGNGMWGTILGISSTDVFMFVLFASFFNLSGIGQVFINLASGLFGSFRGGPAKVSVIGSACFGTISGSSVANILTIGSVTIPMMKQIGYSPRMAGAIEAVASTGGMLMPPFLGAAAFVMADYLQVPYSVIISAAVIPAILYYLALIFAIDFEAQKLGLGGIAKDQLPNVLSVIKRGWHLFTPLFLLIYLLVVKHYSPSRAALFGIAAVIICSLLAPSTRENWRGLLKALHVGARSSLEVSITCAAVGIVVGIIEVTGLGVKLSQTLISLSGGSLLLLLFLTMIASFILGLGLTPTACYLTLAVLVAPTLIQMGISPLAAHFFVFVFGIIGMITPPVAISAYVSASVAGGEMFSTGVTAFLLAMPIYIVPYMFVFDPSLLGIGPLWVILVTVAAAAVGVWAFASAIQGWIFKKSTIWERLIILSGGLLLIKPGITTDIIGLLLVLLAVVIHRARTAGGLGQLFKTAG